MLTCGLHGRFLFRKGQCVHHHPAETGQTPPAAPVEHHIHIGPVTVEGKQIHHAQRVAVILLAQHIPIHAKNAHIPVLQRVNLQAAREALQQGGNPGDPATMRQYFTALRSWIGENMDKSGMMKTLQEQSLPFKTVSEAFHLIEEDTFSVYIPLGDGESACRPLSEGRANREDYRRAGQYSVSIYEQHFRDLLNSGDLLPLSDGSAILINLRLYDPEMGLSLKSDAGRADFI